MNQSREDWPRLGSYVVSARKSAGFGTRRAFATAIGVTDRTLGKLEGGERVGNDTLAAVAEAVGWTPDSPRRILAGDEPRTLRSSGHPDAPPLHQDARQDADVRRVIAARLFPGDRLKQSIFCLIDPVTGEPYPDAEITELFAEVDRLRAGGGEERQGERAG